MLQRETPAEARGISSGNEHYEFGGLRGGKFVRCLENCKGKVGNEAMGFVLQS